MRTASVVIVGLFALAAVHQDGLKLGEPVPDVAMKGSDGKEVKLSDYRSNADKKTEGQVVVIYFGSATCPGAIPASEIKRVSDPWNDSKSGVKFIAIYVCGHDKDTEKVIEKYIKSNEPAFTTVMDTDKKLRDHFDATKVNMTYVLDKAGKLVYRGAFGTVKKKKIEKATVADAVQAAKEGKEAPKSDASFMG
ncbi:MAG: redoxin domain-containing protein [Planctomycetes bacterium]|nr:redoxin domain-containing protein [Planctomycetota bacterium]